MASSSLRPLSLIIGVLVLCLYPGTSFAGKDHCRTVMLEGSAGDTSTDSVVFQMVDENGAVVIDQSCQVTVQASESAESLGERIPLQWFYVQGDPCLDDGEALIVATKPNGKIKYPKKVCSGSSGPSGPSCKIKFTYKVKKSTGEVKKGPQLDICCYEGPDCKGSKWGTTTANPINLQVRNNSVSLAFLPAAASLPAVVGASSDLVVDPIGMEQLPFPDVNDCRAEIATDIELLTNRISSVLRNCHSSPAVPDQSVCNTVSPSSDPTGSIVQAATSLRQQVRDACSSLGSPAKFSYAECPAPCAGTITAPTCLGGPNDGLTCRTDAECDSAKLCGAGNLGSACSVNADCGGTGVCLDEGLCTGPSCSFDADCDVALGDGRCVRKGDGVCKNRCVAPVAAVGDPCSLDTECDSSPGSGDGRCADWAEVGDCATCLATTAVESSMLQLFGPSGSPLSSLSDTGKQCKNWIGQIAGQLQKVLLKETRGCQKLRDSGKTALPLDTPKCKDADRKGKRAKAIAKILQTLQAAKGCTLSGLAELDSCGNDALSLAACIVAAVGGVNQAYGVAATPDSRCGDAKRIGEQCDDGNTAGGDGCDADCNCEGVCGDGTRNPLAVCGELCDDGNSANGDGCDNNCTPTGCGNGIITAGEECEADADCPTGVTCNSACTCGDLPVCGDGVRAGTEVCDDGSNNGSGDGFCLGDCSGVQTCGDNVANGTEDCDGGDDGNCPGLCQLDCSCGAVLPVLGDLSPCDPTVLDRYRFDIGVGEAIVITADTTDSATAADLCFDFGSDCDTADTILGDDDIACTFPPPTNFGCPQDTFVASGNGTCTVEVTACFPDCADVSRANYVLTVTRDGSLTPLVLLNDNEPN